MYTLVVPAGADTTLETSAWAKNEVMPQSSVARPRKGICATVEPMVVHKR